MKVNIAGIVPFSTIDLRGKTAIVFFFAECPFRCIYCQNYEYWDYKNLVEVDEMKSMIDRAKEFVDGVVFSGGEPTFQPLPLFDLLKYCKSPICKQSGLVTAIQTNGYRYDIIKKCLPYLDLISLDVKAPLNKETYARICGIDEKVAESAIKSIKKILDDRRFSLEIKTTIYKEFVDLLPDIKKDIPEGIDWIIQKGYTKRVPPQISRTSGSCSTNQRFEISRIKDSRFPNQRFGISVTELKEEEIKRIAENLAKDRKNVWIRTESGDKKIS